MGLLSPLTLVSPIVKPTMDSLRMMKGSYRLLKESKIFAEFADKALLDISHIELWVQSVFISRRFLKLGGGSNQTSFNQKILRFGIVACDGMHQAIQWELRYKIVPRIYQIVSRTLSVLAFVRMISERSITLNLDWHSRLPQVDLGISLGGLVLRSINAYSKHSLLKYFRVAVDGLSFYAQWRASSRLKWWSDILKNISYLVKAGDDIYKIWQQDSQSKTKKGVVSQTIETLPFIIVPSISLFRALRF